MATNIWCVGRNFKDHAAEMQAEIPTKPLIFLKSGSCISNQTEIPYPPHTQCLHHELELAVQLGSDLQPKKIALALDLTARDLQTEAKQKGKPWCSAKSFKNSCPMSESIDFESFDWFNSLNFELKSNGVLKQQGDASQMIFPLPEIIQHLSDVYPLTAGDWILTGTPAGVSEIKVGDSIQATLEDKVDWRLRFI